MSFSSVAEKSFTEIDTSPKEIAPFQIARIDLSLHLRVSPPAIPSESHRKPANARPLSIYRGGVAGTPYQPMLATAGPLPVGPGWAYELKWDGVRAIADLSPSAGTRLYA